NKTKNDYRQSPPCKPHEAVVDVGLTHHGNFYLDEKRNVATQGRVRKFGSPADSRRLSELELGNTPALYLHGFDRLQLAYARDRDAHFFPARSRVDFRSHPGGRDDLCVSARLAWWIFVGRRRLCHQQRIVNNLERLAADLVFSRFPVTILPAHLQHISHRARVVGLAQDWLL